MSEHLQTMPIDMGSAQYIENLPDDILLEIFSYLSFDDLVHSVYHVSSRFRSVSQDSHLWRKLQYNPAFEETDDEIVNILRQTPKLQTLNLDKRDVRSPVLYAFLENCSGLRKLMLNINQRLSEQSVKSMVLNCQQLEHLTIPDKNLSTLEAVQMIGQLQKLKTLNIIGLSDFPHLVSLRPIGDGCPLLQHLDIKHQSFNTADLKYLIQMKRHQLQSISIKCTTFDGRCTIPYLTVCKTLKKLTIGCSLHNVEAPAEYWALRSMQNVTSLSFIGMQHADVNDLVNLFSDSGMSHVIELKLNFYVSYDDRLSETICHNCPLLKVLGFTDCFKMTDKSLENLHKLQELEYLVLNYCEVTDRGVDFVLKCKRLKFLSLSHCTGLTERSMNQLIDLNVLQTLQLDYCNIKEFPLTLIPSRLTKLKVLSINCCEGVDWKGLHQLRAKMPHLTVHREQ